MAQVTLYLDAETERKLRAAALASGMSMSQWVGDLIRRRTTSSWPSSISKLRGAWADMPTAEEIRSGTGSDVPRERF